MPQHQDQQAVILTEVGRQSGSTGVHVIDVQFITDVINGATATMQFKQSGDVTGGSETTTHKLTISKGTTTLGTITWQRVITLHNAANSIGGEVLEPIVREPPDSGNPTAINAPVWTPTLESGPTSGTSPTWSFALHLTHTNVTVTTKVVTKNVRRWMVQAFEGTTLRYRGYLTAIVATSGSEFEPIDPDDAPGVGKKSSKKKPSKKVTKSAASKPAASKPAKKATKQAVAAKPAKKAASKGSPKKAAK